MNHLPRRTTLLACALWLTSTGVLADLVIEPVPADAPQGFSQVFSKHVDVLGLHVYASSNTNDNKVLHAARTLAQWIDNDEDGQPDEPAVHATMLSLHASMIMWQTENEFEQSGAEDIIPDEVFDSTVLQLLFGDETRIGYPENQHFDASGKVEDFLGVPRVAQEEHDIILPDAAKVTMDGLRGVDDMGWEPQAAEGRRDLGPDESGFAHPADDNVAGAVGDQFHGLRPVRGFASGVRCRDLVGDTVNGLRFTTKDFRKKSGLVTHRGIRLALRRRSGWLCAHRGV